MRTKTQRKPGPAPAGRTAGRPRKPDADRLDCTVYVRFTSSDFGRVNDAGGAVFVREAALAALVAQYTQRKDRAL